MRQFFLKPGRATHRRLMRFVQALDFRVRRSDARVEALALSL